MIWINIVRVCWGIDIENGAAVVYTADAYFIIICQQKVRGMDNRGASAIKIQHKHMVMYHGILWFACSVRGA